MKSVSSSHIIGFPTTVKEQINVPVPQIGGNLVNLYSDGSIFDPQTGRYYAPEPEDGNFWQMRKEFDEQNRITPSDRYLMARQAIMESAVYGMVG